MGGQCSGTERQGIGLEPSRGTRAPCGAPRWTSQPCARPRPPPTSQRAHPCPHRSYWLPGLLPHVPLLSPRGPAVSLCPCCAVLPLRCSTLSPLRAPVLVPGSKVWDALTGDEKHSFDHSHIVRTCDFSKVSQPRRAHLRLLPGQLALASPTPTLPGCASCRAGPLWLRPLCEGWQPEPTPPLGSTGLMSLQLG